MPSFNGKVRLYAPGDEIDNRDGEAVRQALDATNDATIPLAGSESAFIEEVEVRDGHLFVGAWTGSENGDGWYVTVHIPLLPTDALRTLLADLSGTLANFSERFAVEKVRTAPVDADGRVSVGKEYAGENKRVAVLAETQHE